MNPEIERQLRALINIRNAARELIDVFGERLAGANEIDDAFRALELALAAGESS